MRCNSWIVIDRQTGQAVAELFSAKLAQSVRRDRFDVLCAYEYLTKLNNIIKKQLSALSL